MKQLAEAAERRARHLRERARATVDLVEKTYLEARADDEEQYARRLRDASRESTED